jgi:hypothetical protein
MVFFRIDIKSPFALSCNQSLSMSAEIEGTVKNISKAKA